MKTVKGKNFETYKANTFRTFEDEEKQIRLEFGTRSAEEDEQLITINTAVQISPKNIMALIERLILTAYLYQEENKIDLGLKGPIKEESKDGE